jgi:DNA-binding IclR family transcriptional regulator
VARHLQKPLCSSQQFHINNNNIINKRGYIMNNNNNYNEAVAIAVSLLAGSGTRTLVIRVTEPSGIVSQQTLTLN